MKLHDLAIGARFEYNGKVFVKTGPITATSEEGGQQMIPRYAVLKPLDVTPADTPEPAQEKVSETAIRIAFERFYQVALRSASAAAHEDLEAARDRFLRTLLWPEKSK